MSSAANAVPRFGMSQDLACQSGKLFRTQLKWHWSMNIIEVLWCRFQQCLGTFTIFLVKAAFETGLFRHLWGYVFGVHNFENAKPTRAILLFKKFKISCRFWKRWKKFRKNFLFLRCLHLNWYQWIVSVKNRVLFLDSQCCNKESQDLAFQ